MLFFPFKNVLIEKKYNLTNIVEPCHILVSENNTNLKNELIVWFNISKRFA